MGFFEILQADAIKGVCLVKAFSFFIKQLAGLTTFSHRLQLVVKNQSLQNITHQWRLTLVNATALICTKKKTKNQLYDMHTIGFF